MNDEEAQGETETEEEEAAVRGSKGGCHEDKRCF